MIIRIFSFIALTMMFHISFADDHLTTICSADRCDLPGPLFSSQELSDNQVVVIETSPKRFMHRYTAVFSQKNNGGWQKILIDEKDFSDSFPIIGFGGAFTDTSAILFQHLTPGLQTKLLEAYFSFQGNAYSLGRVPVASNDFSCRAPKHGLNMDTGKPTTGPCYTPYSLYTYADKPDNSLNNFALQDEDLLFKIPMIKAALAMTKNNAIDFRLFASAWSAPAWMKTNNSPIHGKLESFYQGLWAEYFIKFLKAYQQQEIKFWALTVQNEPEENFINERFQTWQTMYFTAEEEANFVKNYLGPALSKFASEYGSLVNIIIHDDQVTTIADKTKLLSDADFAKYVAGAGLHWYATNDYTFDKLDKAFKSLNKAKKPAKRFILGTEACEGYLPFSRGPSLGSWSRGEAYAHDIIGDLNHHVSGWMDWNLLLNMEGGPNWAKNYVDAPILADLGKQILYLQPMFYYLGHFSKFIRPNSRLLDSKSEGYFPLEEVTFKVPAYNGAPETIVTVVLNRDQFGRTYYIKNYSKTNNKYLNLSIPGHSIQTIIYKAS